MANKSKGKSLLASTQTPRALTNDTFDEVCFSFATGRSLSSILNHRKIDPNTWWSSVRNRPGFADKWRQAGKDAAFMMMDEVRETALRQARARPSPATLTVLFKATQAVAQALDNGMWGDKVQVSAQSLVINTNLAISDDDKLRFEAMVGDVRMVLVEAEPENLPETVETGRLVTSDLVGITDAI